MQEAGGRLFERHSLHALEQIGLAELGRMKPGGALTFADEHGMHLLTQGAFPACHHRDRSTGDSATSLQGLG
jgi:hypothetical protein